LYGHYVGKIVEIGPTSMVIDRPYYPYSKALLAATALIDPDHVRSRLEIKGISPNPIDVPSGCTFYSRCGEVRRVYIEKKPEVIDIGPNHSIACHLFPRSVREIPSHDA
jgi:oligopeptide transport system ATP-binding protein